MAKPNDWSKSIASKASANSEQEARHAKWQSYWEGFFNHFGTKGLALANRVPPKEGWLRTDQLGPTAAAWLHKANDRMRAIIWLQGPNRLPLFDKLFANRDIINAAVGAHVIWDRMDNKKSSMIFVESDCKLGSDCAAESQRYTWFSDKITSLANAVRPFAV